MYRVKARNSVGLSSQSNYVRAETPEAPVLNLPDKPSGLQVTIALDIYVTFSWTGPADSSITHYKVMRRIGDSGEFTTISDNTGSAKTEYTDDSVPPDTGYEYRVIAVNGDGDSPESDSLAVQTLPQPTAMIITPHEEPLVTAQQQENSRYGTEVIWTGVITAGRTTTTQEYNSVQTDRCLSGYESLTTDNFGSITPNTFVRNSVTHTIAVLRDDINYSEPGTGETQCETTAVRNHFVVAIDETDGELDRTGMTLYINDVAFDFPVPSRITANPVAGRTHGYYWFPTMSAGIEGGEKYTISLVIIKFDRRV